MHRRAELCSAAGAGIGVGAEPRGALFAVRGQAFPDVGTTEPDELQPERRFEGGTEHAIPVIEAAFGPADGVLRASGEPLRQACCGGEHIVVVDADGDQTDAFGLLPDSGSQVSR